MVCFCKPSTLDALKRSADLLALLLRFYFLFEATTCLAFRARRFAYLKKHFGGLLKKLVFLGRTLLLRLWASKPVLVQECWLQG